MAAAFSGNYVVWGTSLGATGASVGAITGYYPSGSMDRASNIKEIKDSNGATGTVVSVDEKYDLTIDVVPYSASSASGAAGNFKLPAILEVVTITGPTGDGAPTFAGKYLFISGSKKVGTEEGTMSWKLRRYIDNTIPAQA